MLLITTLFSFILCKEAAVEVPEVSDWGQISEKDPEKFRISDEQRLFRHILRGYDTSVRPIYNASKIVNVFMGLTLTHIFNIDERNQVLALNVWVEQSWNDERIHWEPSDYGNISKLTVGANYVWRPDIVLYNNARDFSRGFVDTNLHITNDGFVQWAPPAKVHSICRMRTEFFPFDDQHCALEFGSWIYDSTQMDLQMLERYDGKAPFTIDSYTENGEWEIVANRTKRLIRGRNSIYPTIVFEIHLRRRMLYFLYNIIVPCIMLSILTITQFILPCESCEKITLGLTVLLAYSVFSFNIAENMPETSDAVPLIAIYLMAIMSISGLSVCFSVGILNMRHGADSKYRIPFILDFIGFKILARIFGGDKCAPGQFTSNGKIQTNDLLKDLLDFNPGIQTNEEKPLDDSAQRWNQLSNIFDRFFFCLITVMTVSTTITLLFVCPRFSERNFEAIKNIFDINST
ncbi:hypothetical protein FO519_006726 [Halicephalobus sp. NKZ332]|nr:hypothetical protein FO519_006726 [Halicephalobus sp. NKZ332]